MNRRTEPLEMNEIVLLRKSGNENLAHVARMEKLAELESVLSGDYLGDDFTKAVRAGELAGDSVFIAGASQPLDRRKAIVQEWRGRTLQAMIEGHECAPYFFEHVEPEFADRVRSGDCDVMELAAKLDATFEAIAQDARARRRAASDRLMNAARVLIQREGHSQFEPSAGVILATGEHRLFACEAEAREFGNAAGCRYLFFSCTRFTLLRGSSPD